MVTSAPSRAKKNATARPMSESPPVIRATLSSNCRQTGNADRARAGPDLVSMRGRAQFDAETEMADSVPEQSAVFQWTVIFSWTLG